jgi:biopolymer transport protein ExbD
MAFGSLSDNDDGDDGDLADINMIPLIDVMLVLLVIFIVTAPLLTHAVKVELPKASLMPNPTPPEHVELAVDAASRLRWNGTPIEASELDARFAVAAKQAPQPELQLRADRTTPYEKLAELMSAAARAGLTRIGFVTEPKR